MINKLQELKGKTKPKIYQNIENNSDEMNYRRQSGYFSFDEDPSAISAQGIGKIFHGVSLILKDLKTNPQVKIMNINYYDLYYTVIGNRDGKNVENDDDNILEIYDC